MNECIDMNNVGMGGKDDTNSILWDYSAENIKVNTFSLLRKIYTYFIRIESLLQTLVF